MFKTQKINYNLIETFEYVSLQLKILTKMILYFSYGWAR